mmetsp:Transcript_272/g.257  ORF Transcript_272/g.257 Transcript_272/m.257 type:complete len:360 (+) Transcript_272:38-1117(+)
MAVTCKRILLYTLYIIMILVGLFFTIVGAMFFSTKFNTSGECLFKPSEPYTIVHRGDTAVSQENTIEAGVSAVKKGYGTEFDIFLLTTGEFVLFHDDNALETTGTDLEIEDASLSEFQALRYKSAINGVTYSNQPSPPLLKDFLKAVCEENPNAVLDFDIKFSINTENMEAMNKVVDDSPCNCENTANFYIYAVGNPWDIGTVRDSLENFKCKNGKVANYYHPDTYPLGEYFFLRTRFFINLYDPDIVNIEHQILDEHTDLLEDLNNDDFCTATYSNFEEKIKQYDVNTYRVIDTSIASLTKDVYDYNENTYRALIAMTVIGVIMLAAGLLLLILTCGGCLCKSSEVTPMQEENKMEIA